MSDERTLIEGTFYIHSVNLDGQAADGDTIPFVDEEDIPFDPK